MAKQKWLHKNPLNICRNCKNNNNNNNIKYKRKRKMKWMKE